MPIVEGQIDYDRPDDLGGDTDATNEKTPLISEKDDDKKSSNVLTRTLNRLQRRLSKEEVKGEETNEQQQHIELEVRGEASRSSIGEEFFTTSFMDDQTFDDYVSERLVKNREEGKEEPTDRELNEIQRDYIKERYPEMDDSFRVRIKDGKLQAAVKERRLLLSSSIKEKDWVGILTSKGLLRKNLRGELKKALGLTREEILKRNDEENKEDQVRADREKEKANRPGISNEERETHLNQANKINERMVERNNENEIIRDKMGWKNRIKEIFKKHGVTVFSVLSAMGVTIGVSISNLSSTVGNLAKAVGKRLAKLAKDIGKGLKDLGKKVAQLIPGMIGTSAKFIFNAAGEALGQAAGFIAENAWLLILFVVTYIINKTFGNKKK